MTFEIIICGDEENRLDVVRNGLSSGGGLTVGEVVEQVISLISIEGVDTGLNRCYPRYPMKTPEEWKAQFLPDPVGVCPCLIDDVGGGGIMITLALTLATTGLARPATLDDPQFPRPVALSGLQWDANGVSGEYFGTIRHEDVSVSAAAEKLHGVSDRIAKSRGLPERTAISWITNTIRTSSALVGWGLDFDLDVLRAALIRHGTDPEAIPLPGGGVMPLVRPLLKTYDLQTICAPIVGKQDDSGAQALPTLAEALTAVAPEVMINPSHMKARAKACRVLFKALCAKGLIPDLQEVEVAA